MVTERVIPVLLTDRERCVVQKNFFLEHGWNFHLLPMLIWITNLLGIKIMSMLTPQRNQQNIFILKYKIRFFGSHSILASMI